MESGYGEMRMNVQDDDRLSNLPNDIIRIILSLVDTKLVVQTSALSPKWRYLWTSLPRLNLSSEDFKWNHKFYNFVAHVLSCRNNQAEISSAKLSYHGRANHELITKILNYAFSYNVKQLTLSWLHDYGKEFRFPLSLSTARSLEHLTIVSRAYSVILKSTWELTSLTALHLESLTLSDELIAKDTRIFSKCVNLKKLVLRYCNLRYHTMTRPNGVNICHPRLSDLTLEYGPDSDYKVINVVAPQLKNLTVREWQGLHLIYAPELVSMRFKGRQSGLLKFSSYELCSLENVDLCITKSYKPNKPYAHSIFGLLHQFRSVKYLTLNLEIFELLAPVVDLMSHQTSPFVNLERLTVYPEDLFLEVLQNIPPEVKKYLLDGSPSATFIEVSYGVFTP